MTHRCVDERADLEYRRQRIDPTPMLAVVDFVHAAEELERVTRRQLIPELRTLAEHGADLKREPPSLSPGYESKDAHVAGIRHENAGEDLQRRRLAGAVRTDEGDPLARRD